MKNYLCWDLVEDENPDVFTGGIRVYEKEEVEAALDAKDARIDELERENQLRVSRLESELKDARQARDIMIDLTQPPKSESKLRSRHQPRLGPNGECPICGGIECRPGCRDGMERL